VAATVKTTVAPVETIWLIGCVVMLTGTSTVRLAAELAAVPTALLTSTE
jgi:hypothetical protein